ncbi:glycine cleavage system protein GcvH [Candidatus Woesearchaeota archaeon]|nr:glycine cleavage system protein GcvH [Candidatus Woesearchaeota archaeon]
MAKENPSDNRYTREHEWVKVEGSIATMGITDVAQELLTDVVFVELPEIGKKAEQMKPLCVVESVKSASDVFAPVSGEVVEVNDELKNHPELVNQDAFNKGWMVKLKVKDKDEVNKLMTAEEYDSFTKES